VKNVTNSQRLRRKPASPCSCPLATKMATLAPATQPISADSEVTPTERRAPSRRPAMRAMNTTPINEKMSRRPVSKSPSAGVEAAAAANTVTSLTPRACTQWGDALDVVTTAPPPVRGEDARVRRLGEMKRRAGGLLLGVSAAFVVVTVIGHGRGWLGWVQAALEASMVGGVADWFAVTALFRHPLGLPIPHTAIIRERKDQFGETLGSFVQENFLSAGVLTERLRAARLVDRVTAWLALPENSAMLAAQVADLVVGLADAVKDEDVHEVLAEGLERGVGAVPVAPLAGRALRMMTAEGRHQQLLDSILRGLERFLEDSRPALRARFAAEFPRWVPNALEERIFARMLDGVEELLHDVNADPEHEVRARFDEWLEEVIDRLEHSPELFERGEELKHDLLDRPEVRAWTSSLWADVKAALRRQAGDPDSELRRRLAETLARAGQQLRSDPVLGERIESRAESAVVYMAEHFHDELADLISGTISRWNAEETSDKLELLLGPDLQFIRINGTVVGGLVGLAIHGIARLIA
jgi:uncharacterized membrane-anchored protein YjiN (DUF445 family)